MCSFTYVHVVLDFSSGWGLGDTCEKRRMGTRQCRVGPCKIEGDAPGSREVTEVINHGGDHPANGISDSDAAKNVVSYSLRYQIVFVFLDITTNDYIQSKINECTF